MTPSDRKRKADESSATGLVGATVDVDPETGDIIAVSTRDAADVDRWESMPTLDAFPNLIKLDLHKNRYIKDLHVSIAALKNLKVLTISACGSLTALPDSIGNLHALEEVSGPPRFGTPCHHVCLWPLTCVAL